MSKAKNMATEHRIECLGCVTTKPHTPTCAFDHFLAYTNYAQQPAEVIEMLRVAYEHGSQREDKNLVHDIERAQYAHSGFLQENLLLRARIKELETTISEMRQENN